tara:strand:- start:204 stop:431 length:228 start_codon:yes stop_codon:yes gene_type:complete
VSANIVPDISQGNPVKRIDLKYSTATQAMGKEKMVILSELDLKKLYKNKVNPEYIDIIPMNSTVKKVDAINPMFP